MFTMKNHTKRSHKKQNPGGWKKEGANTYMNRPLKNK